MGTGYGPLIKKLVTKTVNHNAIEIRLQEDYDTPKASAKRRREILVESATDAGLIVDEKFDAKAIESIPEDAIGTKPTGPQKSSGSNGQTSPKEPKQRHADPPPKPPAKDPPPPEDPPAAAPIQVVVQVDGSKMEPAQLAELIRLLREPK